jgi:RND family efflux transporter MFP subunit
MNASNARLVPQERNSARVRVRRLVGGLAIVAAAIAGGTCYGSAGGHDSTHIAEVQTDAVGVRTSVAGVVKRVHVVENQAVKVGDPLIDLDDDLAIARLGEAEKALASARATAESADVQFRAATMSASQTTVAVDLDITRARARAEAAHAQVTLAEAALNRAALDLDLTLIAAPQDGVVTIVVVSEGQTVAEGQAVAQIVSSRSNERPRTASFSNGTIR